MTAPVKAGVVVAYYAGLDIDHADSMRELRRSRAFQCAEIWGAPYPEVARAEMARQALNANLDVVVMIDAHVAFELGAVERIVALALERNAVITGTFGNPAGVCHDEAGAVTDCAILDADGFLPGYENGLAFAAIPVSILRALAESDDRIYNNSAVIDTGFSGPSRPFFSPWQKDGTPVEPGYYVTEDIAFFLRVKRAGFRVLKAWGLPIRCKRPSSFQISSVNVDSPSVLADGTVASYAVCVPSFGAIDREQEASLWGLEQFGVPIIRVHGCPYIDMARSALVKYALDVGMEGVFFLDHDIVFKPEDVLSLIEEAKTRRAMVAAAYCMRKSAHTIIGAIEGAPGERVRWFDEGSVVPALYTGLGFAAIPAEILEDLGTRLPTLECGIFGRIKPYFALDITAKFYCGEDVSFCNRVHALDVEQIAKDEWHLERTGNGWDILIDTRVRIFHKGAYHYGIEDVGIVVPRVSSLETVLCGSRKDARELLMDASELPTETRVAALGLDTPSKKWGDVDAA